MSKHDAKTCKQCEHEHEMSDVTHITDAPYGMHRTPSPIVDVQWREDVEFAALMRAWRESQP